MVIRPAEKRDLSEILKLYAQLETEGDEVLDIEAAKNIFDKMKSYPDYGLYVTEVEGKIVGTFALAVLDNLAHHGAHSGLVEDVVVSEERRGQGIGRQMMMFAMDLCKQRECYKVALSSNRRRTDAHRFYESLGFEIHGYSFSTEL